MLCSYRSVHVVPWRPVPWVYVRQFRKLSPIYRLKHVKLTGSFWCINYLRFQTHPSACYFMHYMILLLRDMLTWSPSLRYLPQFIFILLNVLITKMIWKNCEFFKINVFQNGMMKGYHPYHLWAGWSGTPWFGRTLRRCLVGLGVSMKDCPSHIRIGLSSLFTYTLIKYNHLRLYG
jgi:hypothetical protein